MRREWEGRNETDKTTYVQLHGSTTNGYAVPCAVAFVSVGEMRSRIDLRQRSGNRGTGREPCSFKGTNGKRKKIKW